MRRTALVAILLLSACAARSPMPLRHSADSGVCRATGLDQFRGQAASQDVAIQLIRASGAKDLRWVPPGTMVTMDHRSDRLTVHPDAQNRILSAACT
jgi:hypothetical protein